MTANNAQDSRQAEATPRGFRGKERLKDSAAGVHIHAGTCVRHIKIKVIALGQFQRDFRILIRFINVDDAGLDGDRSYLISSASSQQSC